MDDANYLGEMYLNGDGVVQDDKEAAKWYKIGADEDFMGKGQYELGMMYLQGCGVSKDKEEGIQWLIKAAEEEIFPDASAELGRIYKEGDGVESDIEKSNEWYEKAADTTFAFLYPEVLIKTKKGRKKITKYGVLLLTYVILIGMLVWIGNKIIPSALLCFKESAKVGTGIAIISIISGIFMRYRKNEILNHVGDFLFVFSLLVLSAMFRLITISYPIYIGILVSILILGVFFIKKVKKLDLLGWMLIALSVGMIIGGISSGMQNTYITVTRKSEEYVPQVMETIEFGALTYKVQSNWECELDDDGQGITYYPCGENGWPFIYIYKIQYRLGENRDTLYSDYADLLQSTGNEYTNKIKMLIDDTKAYCTVDTILFEGEKYDTYSYWIIRNNVLYVIVCSDENPISEEFEKICGDFLNGIEFENVYLNDPCPCGSEIKYKYCCGEE